MSDFPPEFVIARLQKEDLQMVVQLEQECGLSSWGSIGYERELLNPQAILLSAYQEKSSEAIGLFSGRLIGEEFELLSIAVHEQFRKVGIGSALLVAGLQAMRAQGGCRGWLEVRSMNFSAIKLYEKFGFQTVGVRRNYYHHPKDDALVMQWGNNFEEETPSGSSGA